MRSAWLRTITTLTVGGRTNTWDSQNRLVSCITSGNTSTFKYGADGLRRQKTTNSVTTDYAYDGTMLVREGHASGGSLTPSTVTATYFQGVQGPCYRRDDTQTETDGQGHTFGKTRWYVYDGLGSVVGELDPLGNMTSSPKYDVYGAVRGNGGTASSKQGFVGSLGHLSEPETGLVYMRARYYDPSIGRFNSEDPSLQGNNWFTYCANNPTNLVDADGKSATNEEIAEAMEAQADRLERKETEAEARAGEWLVQAEEYDEMAKVADLISPGMVGIAGGQGMRDMAAVCREQAGRQEARAGEMAFAEEGLRLMADIVRFFGPDDGEVQ